MKKILIILLLPLIFLIACFGAFNTQQQQNVVAVSSISGGYEENENSGFIPNGNSEIGNEIVSKAMTKLGCRYVWGGGHSIEEVHNPNQNIFDCSSFVCWSHFQGGVDIGTQTTKTLIKMGVEIEYKEIQAGDIILFKTDDTPVSHVGIYIGNYEMVHAPNPSLPVKTEKIGTYWSSVIVSCRRLY